MQITRRIYVVGSGRAGYNFTNPYDCDVYLVDCGEGLLLIDSGAGLNSGKILDCIRSHGFSPEDVRYILLTHGHGDHSGGCRDLRKATGARVLAHPDCARHVTEGDERAIALDVARKTGGYPSDYRFCPCPAEAFPDSGKLRIGEITFTAYDTPGHCSGHYAYLMESEDCRALFSGDSIFLGGRISLQNIWDCSLSDYAETAYRLSGLKFDALLPSHFGIDLTEGMTHIRKAVEVFSGLGIPEDAKKSR